MKVVALRLFSVALMRNFTKRADGNSPKYMQDAEEVKRGVHRTDRTTGWRSREVSKRSSATEDVRIQHMRSFLIRGQNEEEKKNAQKTTSTRRYSYRIISGYDRRDGGGGDVVSRTKRPRHVDPGSRAATSSVDRRGNRRACASPLGRRRHPTPSTGPA